MAIARIKQQQTKETLNTFRKKDLLFTSWLFTVASDQVQTVRFRVGRTRHVFQMDGVRLVQHTLPIELCECESLVRFIEIPAFKIALPKWDGPSSYLVLWVLLRLSRI